MSLVLEGIPLGHQQKYGEIKMLTIKKKSQRIDLDYG